MRSLSSLPKAHLHLHVWQATLRRSTVTEWLCECDEHQLTEMRAEAENKLIIARQKQAEGVEEKRPREHASEIEKYERRIEAFTAPLSVDKLLGPELGPSAVPPPPLRGGSGAESEIWDRQFCMKTLMKTANESGVDQRACLDLAEDAVAEGICWMELGYKDFLFIEDAPGKIEEACANQWCTALTARREAMTKYPSVGLAFIVPCPKGKFQVEEAHAILNFFQQSDPTALAGVGKWGREGPGLEKELGPALNVFRTNLVPIVMMHAGEGYGATGDRIPLPEYDGASFVEEAVAAGATRIGHGIEAARKEATMALLRERNVCLEVCLYSNWLLAMAPWDEEPDVVHPLPKLLANCVPCCLAADDPTIMGAGNGHGLVREYEAARNILKLSDEQLADLARCSIKFSCMPQVGKERALAEIDQWLLKAS